MKPKKTYQKEIGMSDKNTPPKGKSTFVVDESYKSEVQPTRYERAPDRPKPVQPPPKKK